MTRHPGAWRSLRSLLSLALAALALSCSLAACGSAASSARWVVAWPPRRTPHVAVAPPAPQEPLEPIAGSGADDATEPAAASEPAREADPALRPAPRDRYEERAPGVHVREGESQGIGFLEIVLGEVDPEAPLPLIVVLHGRGDRPRVPGGPFEALSHPVRVVMPRGPMLVGEGFGWLPVRVLDGQPELLAAGLRDVSARLARLIEEVRASRATRGPTVVSGFSQGGMLALTLAVRHPTVVGVAFPLAGWLPPPLWPSDPPPEAAPPIRAMHARDDDRIPYEPSAEAYEHLRGLGWDLALSTYDGIGHAMSPEMDATFHAWLERALGAIDRGERSLVEPAEPRSPDAAGEDADAPPERDEPPGPEAATEGASEDGASTPQVSAQEARRARSRRAVRRRRPPR